MGRIGGAVAFVLCMAACSGGAGGASGQPAKSISFVVSSFDVEEGAKPASGAIDAAKAGIANTLDSYASEIVLPSLRSGGPAGDLRPFFSAAAAKRVASGPDRAAFVDEGLPRASSVSTDGDPAVALVGLVGPDGQVQVVTAKFNLALEANASGTPLTVSRSGDLTLVRDGAAWRIDSYAVTATRNTPGGTTATTANG